MHNHDTAYKRFFSYPRTVEDLLRGFIREDWVARLDFSSLERINSNFVSDDLRQQMSDVVWKVRLADQDLYICLLLEFQSTVDPIMALRVASYVLQLYLDLSRRKALTASGKLPPVLPIVLYNGELRWRAPLELAELIEAGPGSLPEFRPHMRYWLLDEGAYAEQDLLGLANVVAGIFRLENAEHPEAWRDVCRDLQRWLAAPDNAGLLEDLARWITTILTPAKFSHLDWTQVTDLQGVETMLAEKVKRWTDEWLQQGEAKGLEKGRAEGEDSLLRRLLLRKYGLVPDWVEARLSEATSEQLVSWAEQVFSASSIDEVFAQH